MKNVFFLSFCFCFCVFLVSYITSNLSPAKRIINRFIYDIWVYCYISASFLHFSATFPSKGVVKTDMWILLIINESNICLSRNQSFLFGLYFKIDELPYCFHSFSKKNWSCRGHNIILEYFKIVLLIARWLYSSNADQFW